MRKQIIYAAVFIFAILSCSRVEMYEPVVKPATEFVVSGEINASCVMNASSVDAPLTRSLIGQQTSTALNGNFIKVSQPVDNETIYHSSVYDIKNIEMPSYREATIVDAQMISPANNIPDLYLRTIVFNPRLTYNYYASESGGVKDTVAYVSRMIGWYPMTYDVPDGLGEENAQALFKNSGCIKEMDGEVCVEFKNKLDGQTDLMMTDMREGRVFKGGFVNNDGDGCDRNIQPYGAFYTDFYEGLDLKYCNYFTFHHYLTAVRLFVKAENSNMILSSWGSIQNAIFVDQPKTAVIALPTVQSTTDEASERIPGGVKSLPFEGVEPVFGKVKSWGDYYNIPVVRTEMFENNASGDTELETMTSELPVRLDDGNDLDKTYIGYGLIRPFVDENNDGKDDLDPDYVPEVQLVTEAGVLSVTLPVTWTDEGSSVALLQEGCIYDIIIDIKTDGTLDAIITMEGEQDYYNLSPLVQGTEQYQTANCYVIKEENLLNVETEEDYDGFVFYPELPEYVDGLPYYTHEDIASVAIYWQDSTMPVAHVDYVHDYIRITLNENSRTGNIVTGNALIAAYDYKRTVIWSWHIWVVEELNDVPMTLGDGTVTFMDRNLGAMTVAGENAEVNISSYGLYYQWGRKDPSPGPPSYDYSLFDMSIAPISTLNGVQATVSDKVVSEPTMTDAARYPLALFYPGSPAQYMYNWIYERDDQLWGYDYTTGTGSKTDYDPCPYGYRVPYQELEAVSMGGTRSFLDARLELTTDDGSLFFPYAGWKGDDVGSPQQTHFWYKVFKGTDIQNGIADITGDHGYHRERMLFLKDGFNVTSTGYGYNDNTLYTPASENNKGYGNRNTATSVRCIKDEGFSMMAVYVAQSIYLKSADVKVLPVNGRPSTVTVTKHNGDEEIESKVIDVEYEGKYFTVSFADNSAMYTVEVTNGKTIEFSVLREIAKATDMIDGGHYVLYAKDGNYETYCLEANGDELKLVQTPSDNLTKDNVFVFEESENSGNNQSYNNYTFGYLKRYSDNYYLNTSFGFSESKDDALAIDPKNGWGSETGHDIDIMSGNLYLIYNQNSLELGIGSHSGNGYKWYIYPVDPEKIKD